MASRKTTNRLRAIETQVRRVVALRRMPGRKTTNRLRAIETVDRNNLRALFILSQDN